MRFDLAAYVIGRHIDYIDRGPNVKRNHINIRCPLCSDDPSHHMGINLETGQWGCWRDQAHRGSKPARLLVALFHISWTEAEQIVGLNSVTRETTLDDLASDLASLGGAPYVRPSIVEQQLDPAFRCWVPHELAKSKSSLHSAFTSYLATRKLSMQDASAVCEQYGLMYASTGRFAQRVIFPIYFEGKLVAWSGRSVGRAENKYLSHPNGDTVKRLVYGYDDAMATGGRVLAITEGPWDRIMTDYLGQQYGVRAVGVLGAAITEPQITLLLRLSDRFDETWILLDDDAEHAAHRVAQRMNLCSPRIVRMPVGIHDPGEFTFETFRTLVQRELRG